MCIFRRKPICLIPVIAAIILILTAGTASAMDASDNTGHLVNSIYPEAAFKRNTESTSVKYINNELVYPETGDVEIVNTDLSLKGRNGLDLRLDRYYSLSQSNLYEPSVTSTAQSISGNVYQVSGTEYKKTITFDLSTGNIVSTVNTQSAYTAGYFNTQNEAGSVADRYNDGVFNYNNEWSNGSNLYWEVRTYSGFTSSSTTLSDPTPYYTYTQALDQKPFTEKYYDLGAGFAFDLPVIERRQCASGNDTVYRDYLHLGRRGVFSVSFGDDGGDSHLKGYLLEDLVLEIDGGTFDNGQMTSRYVLLQKDGRNSYFGSDGRLLGIKDRFGNTITFEHTIRNGYPVITNITDSVGREVAIAYNGSVVTVTVTDAANSSNSRIINYNKSEISGISGKYVLDNVEFQDINGSTDVKTYYEYGPFDQDNSARLDFFNRAPSQGLANQYARLTKVLYPSGTTTEARPYMKLEYGKYAKNLGPDGSMQSFRISKLSMNERNQWKTTRERTFNYIYNSSQQTGQYDGYPDYAYKAQIPSNYIIKTSIDNYYNNETYTYDKKLLQTMAASSGSEHYTETSFTYDAQTSLPSKKVSKIYNAGTQQYMEKAENYSYDSYGDLLAYWDVQASRDSNKVPVNNEHKTTYSYNSSYHYLASKSYKRDAVNTITEEYTPYSGNKSVEWKKVYENSNLKEQTRYLYDTYGNITEERKYLDNWTGFIAYKYDYTDNVTSRSNQFDGAYLTRKWVENIEDTDGNPVAARSGQSAGTIDEVYTYDWFGNLEEVQSGMGGNSKYTLGYDKLGRIISKTYPGTTSSTVEFADNDGSVVSKDENNNRKSEVYAVTGNKVLLQDMTGQSTYGDVLAYYEYDVNGFITGEYNNNKTSVDYIYNSDYSLKSKQVNERYTWFNDYIPYGSTPGAQNEAAAWDWKYTQETVRTYHKSDNYSGLHEHSFDGASRKMKINPGDIIYVEVRVSSTNPVSEIMLQWKEAGSWEHRAYWGENLINSGTDGTASRMYIGSIPTSGQWVTLKIPAYLVGLEGKTVDGTKFTLYNGEADWDRVGLYRSGNMKLLSKESYTYDNAASGGTLTKVTKTIEGVDAAASEQVVTYYDISGFTVKEEKLHDSNGDGTKETTYQQTYSYDYLGNKVQEKSYRAYAENWIDPVTGQPYVWTIKYEYDYAGRIVKLYNISGDYSSKSYNSLGRLASETDIKGGKSNPVYSTLYTYDGLGRLLKEQVPFEKVNNTVYYNVSKYYYDRNGNVTAKMEVKNKYNETEAFNKTEYVYNDRGFLVKTITYDNNSPVNYTQYFYDEAGNKLRMYTGLTSPLTITGLDQVTPGTDTDYAVSKYEYDRFNRLTKYTDPLNHEETYTYDSDGNMTDKTDRRSSSFKYIYDGLGRVTSSSTACTDTSANEAYTYTYDISGNRESSKGKSYEANKYDDLGNLTLGKGSGKELTPVFSARVAVRTQSGYDFGPCSFVTRNDGKILGTYTKNSAIMLSTANSEDDVFGTQNAFAANEAVFYTRYSPFSGASPCKNSDLQKLANGNYLLYIYEHGVAADSSKPNKLMVYESTDGGVSFSYKTTIWSHNLAPYASSGNLWGYANLAVGNAVQLPSGRILMPFTGLSYSGSPGYAQQSVFCAYSDDNGSTWSVSTVLSSGRYVNSTFGIGKCGNQLVINIGNNFLIRGYFKYSTDNGATWNTMSNMAFDTGTYSNVFWGEGDGYTYWLYTQGSGYKVSIYRHRDNVSLPTANLEPYARGSLGSGAVWEGPLNPTQLEWDYHNLFITNEGDMALTASNGPYRVSYIIKGGRKYSQANTYDSEGALAGKTIYQNSAQKSNTSYTYDKLGRLQYVYENSTLTAEYTYDDNGNISSISYSNGNSAEYTYNLANRLVSVTNKQNGTTISQFTYTYYLNGNQASKTDSSGTTSYIYDGLGRISSVTEPGNVAISYTYDDYNNRSNKTVVDSTNTTSYDYSYDKQCKLLTEVKKVNNVTVSTTNYQYDNNGNMTSDGTNTYKYNGFNQLMEFTSGTNVYTYSYNGDGLRIAKIVNGTPTNYIWKDDEITLETDASGATTANYVQGISLIASDISSTRKYYMYNGHGDVVQLADTSGNVAKSYDYDEFGIEKNIDSSDTNPFRYCGEYFDKETGTIYLRARYYDPTIGRFITEDDSKYSKANDPLSLNLYTYCGSDPVNQVDPTGHDGEAILAIALVDGPEPGPADVVAVVYYAGYNVTIYGPKAVEFASQYGPAVWDWTCNAADTVKDKAGDAANYVKDKASKGWNWLKSKFGGGSSNTPDPNKDPNKLKHIFDNAGHNLDGFLQKYSGNQSKAFDALQKATQKVVSSNKITGVFEQVIKVNGFDITVRGNVINGTVKIGTAFIP